jgi:diguanylate cyclase (GGDEF)-like protein/hemerythrin-like metal-binding protein/PAS domain S-box-containing protein
MEHAIRALDAITVPAFAIDVRHKVTAWNHALEKMTGKKAEEIVGTELHWTAFYPSPRPCLADVVVEKSTASLDGLYERHGKARFIEDGLHAEGWYALSIGLRYMSFEARPLKDETGRVIGAIETLHDVTTHKEAGERLKLSASVFENTSEGIMITDSSNRIVSVNKAFQLITGYGNAEVIGEDPKILSSDRHGAPFYDEMWATLAEFGHWQGEIWNRRKNGAEYLVRMYISNVPGDSGPSHYVAIFSDVTKDKEIEANLQHMAHHDFLTGLPNRALFDDRMSQYIARAERDGSGLAVAFLDLDRFKTINDGLGHDAGDQLLKEVAARLRRAVRSIDTVSRQGGDEFVILLSDLKDPHDIAQIASQIISEVAQPMTLAGQLIHVTTSVGISVFPEGAQSADELLAQADAALYHAKKTGRNTYQFFTPDLNAQAFESLVIETSMKSAIGKQMRVEYQPQIDLISGGLVGAEALVSWEHPEIGNVTPSKFIPLAEANGLIRELGRWVILEAAETAASTGTHICVNVSPVQLHDKQLVPRLREAASGLPAGRLGVEITEGAFLHDIRSARGIIEEIRGLGIPVSLDDFGTGQSSLSALHKLPLDCLKIDQSFIREDDASEIVLAILDMCHRLGLDSVGEGVETDEQRDFLLRNGCAKGQGYLFSRPLKKDAYALYAKNAAKGPIIPARDSSDEPLIQWTAAMITGIPEIDREHRKLVEIAAAFGKAGNAESSKVALAALADYTKYHFSREASLMHGHGIRATARHLGEHKAFIDRLAEIRTAFDKDASMGNQDIVDLVISWLREHIMVADKKLARELRAAGYGA